MAAPTLAWVGTVAFDASTGTHDPTYPASGVTAGDAIYVVNVNKDGSGSADPGDPTPAAGWTKVGSGFGGTGTAGAGTGPVHVTVWRRNTDAAGTENGAAVGINLDNPGSGVGRLGMANVFGVRPAAGGTLSEGWASGQDATIGTDYSATMGTDPGIAADDLAVAFAGIDNQTSTAFSAESITATGCTFGTVTEDDEHSTSSGNDIRMVVWDAPCTAGPSSAAATIAATSAGNVSGVGALMRVRESAGGDATVNAVIATATADALVPSVSGGASVAAVQAAATADALVPAVGVDVTVVAVQATATADALVPAVASDAIVIATQAAATADALVPTATGGAGVTAVIATATADALAPSVSGGASGDATVTVPAPAGATAAALVPAASADAAVLAVLAEATAAALLPTIGGGAIVIATQAAATADALIPVVTTPPTPPVAPGTGTVTTASAQATASHTQANQATATAATPAGTTSHATAGSGTATIAEDSQARATIT